MATLESMLATLKEKAVIRTEESLSDPFLTSLLQEAIIEHNPVYSIASLPTPEVYPVILLAWIKLCHTRASKEVNTSNIKGGGMSAPFSQENKTPYDKNMSLAARLREAYNHMMASMGGVVGTDKNTIAVSTIVVQSMITDALTPGFAAPYLPAPVLSKEAVEDEPDSIVLTWTSANTSQFMNFILMFSMNEGIHESWNSRGKNSIPYVSSDSEKIWESSNQNQKTVKIEDLETGDNYFIVILKSADGRYSYSNEVLVQVT
jgi:hypothetical protein